MKGFIIRFDLKEIFYRRGVIDDFAWHEIDKICGGEECLIPKFQGHRGIF
jgi:hypothetical protein